MSLIGIVTGTLLTRPIDEKVVQNFLQQDPAFRRLGKIPAKHFRKEPALASKENTRDIISVFIAVPWQLVPFMFMMNLVFKAWSQALTLGLIFIGPSTALYFTRYRHLSTEVTWMNNGSPAGVGA